MDHVRPLERADGDRNAARPADRWKSLAVEPPRTAEGLAMTAPSARWSGCLPDGRRLASPGRADRPRSSTPSATPAAVAAAYRAAARRFRDVLDELCAELPALRAPALPAPAPCRGRVAQRMEAAVAPSCGGRLHHADGGGRGKRRRRDPRRDQGRSGLTTCARFRQQRRRHRPLSRAGRSDKGRPRQPAGPPGFVRERSPCRVGRRRRRRHFGRARPQLLAGRSPTPSRFSPAAPPTPTRPRRSSRTPSIFPATRVSCGARRASLQPDSDLGDRLVTRGVEPLDSESIATALEGGLAVARASRRSGPDRGRCASSAGSYAHLLRRGRPVGARGARGRNAGQGASRCLKWRRANA